MISVGSGWKLRSSRSDRGIQCETTSHCIRIEIGNEIIQTGPEPGPLVTVAELSHMLQTHDGSLEL